MKTALDLLINQMHEIWRIRNYVMSLFMLDIIETYDRMIHKQFIHMLRAKKILENMTNWMHSFMTNKIIILIIENYKIKKTLINAEISQKSSLFFIFYLFYAAKLLEACNNTSEKLSTSEFIDDINFLVYELFMKCNCNTLIRTHDKCLNWIKCYRMFFNLRKYKLIHLLHMSCKFFSLDSLYLNSCIAVWRLLVWHLDEDLEMRYVSSSQVWLLR